MQIRTLRESLPECINLSELYRAADLDPATMRVRMHRGKDLSQDESDAIAEAMSDVLDKLNSTYDHLQES